MRLIDADALSKKLCETTIFIKDGEVFQRMINDAPTVHADRPHGEWINREKCQVDEDAYEVATCSECGAEITIEYPHDSYCPNCGADMRKENK